MSIRAFFLATLMAVSGLFVAAPAFADPAEATTSVNVRSGPGTSYRVVDVLRTGERVEVDRCSGGWCRIEHLGPDGWVSARYLTVYDSRSPRRPPTPRRDNDDVGFCIEGPNFSFGVNCDDDDDRGRRPGRFAQVCFYEHINFGGDSFCARPGESDRRLSRRWNDRISSIEVRGNASALVCEHSSFRGRCARVTRDVRNIGRRNNDIISSYRVER